MRTELSRRIDQLLWDDWDPIGVKEFADNARDEYIVYVLQVEKLLMNKVSKEELTNYLYDVETKRMGLTGDIERCNLIADKLMALD